jgi:hypothetical protein
VRGLVVKRIVAALVELEKLGESKREKVKERGEREERREEKRERGGGGYSNFHNCLIW